MSSPHLNRPKRSKEEVALDVAVDAMARARSVLVVGPHGFGAEQAIEKIDKAMLNISELRK